MLNNKKNLKQSLLLQHQQQKSVKRDLGAASTQCRNSRDDRYFDRLGYFDIDNTEIYSAEILTKDRQLRVLHSLGELAQFQLISPAPENLPIIDCSRLGNFQLVNLEWRSTFTLNQNSVTSAYILYLPFSGYVEPQIDLQQQVKCSSTTAIIVNPGRSFTGITSEKGQALSLAIDRQSIEGVLAKLLDRSLKQPLVFDPALDLTTDFGVSLKEFVQFLGLNRDPQTVSSPLIQDELERALITCLLKGLNNNYSDEILYHTHGAFAYYIIKARSFIESHLHDDLHLTDIAAAAGVSPRLLQKAFAQDYGCSPMRFVTKTRLERIRAALERSTIGTRIIDVMMCYGITQGGKFAKEYQQLFGEKPSDTLKRSSQYQQPDCRLWQGIDDGRSERLVGGVVGADFPEIDRPEIGLIPSCWGDPVMWGGYLRLRSQGCALIGFPDGREPLPPLPLLPFIP